MTARQALCALLLTACGAWAQAPTGNRLTLRDAHADGHRLTEVSGLAWDADGQDLYAVSDRGLLYRLALARSGDPPLTLQLLSARPLQAPDGLRVDAEGLSLLPAHQSPSGQTELLVAGEGPARLLRYRTDGTGLGEWPLPAALVGARALRRGNSQIEAVAHHPALGLLVAAEVPTAGAGRAEHEVHGAGRSWRFAAGSGRQPRLKAMDVLPDGRLLVLERAQVVGGGGLVNRLLAIDLTACGGATACPVTEHQVLEGEDEAANHEGMTTLDGPQGQRWVLLVSDDRGARRQGTRFQLVVGP
jgi:hypothetical protein